MIIKERPNNYVLSMCIGVNQENLANHNILPESKKKIGCYEKKKMRRFDLAIVQWLCDSALRNKQFAIVVYRQTGTHESHVHANLQHQTKHECTNPKL